MTPIRLLTLVLALTVLAWTTHQILRQLRRRQLRRLAVQWRMGYAERDLFNLAARITSQLPVPAAADLRVLDLLYASEGNHHRYVFTVEYTRGIISSHRRECRVMTFCEPRDTAARCPSPLLPAPEQLPILDQYRHLHDHNFASSNPRSSP